MYSSTSSTWVQDASLLSRRPSVAEIDRPEAQMPWKPGLLDDLGGEAVMRLHQEGQVGADQQRAQPRRP